MLKCPVIVQPLPTEEGGGFVTTVPDLPDCMSDGETPEEAFANVQGAIAVWLEAAQDMGCAITFHTVGVGGLNHKSYQDPNQHPDGRSP